MDNSNLFHANVTVYKVSDEGETAIGVYLLILGWLSWIGNGVVIVLMTRERHSLEPQDFLTFNLSVSDAGIALFGYSRGILEVFNVFMDEGTLIQKIWTCQVDGFLILLFGLISINTLTAISVIRYIKGCQPHHALHITKFNVSVVIASVWLWALFWSGAPLVGWGSYRARKYGTCEIDWVQAQYSVPYRLYVLGIFTFNFFIPIIIIIFSYVSIIRRVSSSHKSSRGGAVSERQRLMERNITRLSLILCAAFLLAWSPYAVISMWEMLGYQVPPVNSILASLFAKSASFYNPFIYLGMSSKFRHDLIGLFRCLRPDPAHNAMPRPLRPGEVQANVDIPGIMMKERGGGRGGEMENNLDSELGSDRTGREAGEGPSSLMAPSTLMGPSAHGLKFMRKLSNSGRL